MSRLGACQRPDRDKEKDNTYLHDVECEVRLQPDPRDEVTPAISGGISERLLRTGQAALPTKRSRRKTGVKDVERGLTLKLRIENYTSNRETKDFIVEQAHLVVATWKPASPDRALLGGQRTQDGAAKSRIVGRDVARKEGDHVALPVDDVLAEIPGG